ncbi:MAG: bifunctional phosphoribosylaminoimidazolecarboxamide formyltransferase/IMP cyclohydrolase [Halobacteriales archaeon]
MHLAGVASNRGPVLRHLHRRRPAGGQLEVVVSDDADAPILAWAKDRGIETSLLPSGADGTAATQPLTEQLADVPVDLVCLDGYCGPLSDADLERLPPILDRHDALLPAFPGPDPIGAALDAGVAVTGCTVTAVSSQDERAADGDAGRILAQEPVPVSVDDAEALADRILREGALRAYPRAVEKFAQDGAGRDNGPRTSGSGDAGDGSLPEWLLTSADRVEQLRYGENPHQAAALYTDQAAIEPSVIGAEQLNPEAKPLSYNNYNDADAALGLIREFDRPAAAIIKHANPTGCAVAHTLAEAYARALRTDEMSAFGGVVALNRRCDQDTAERIADSFKEVVIAPEYSDGALDILVERDDLRILAVGESIPVPEPSATVSDRSIAGGRLVQERDEQELTTADLETRTDRAPSAAELETMAFAWPVVKHVKSNAIVLATETETVGIGMGQVSRIDAVRLATRKAREHAVGKSLDGAVMASDAFFPFPDGVEAAAEAGIRAVVQPGGSVNDEAVIEACDAHGIAMAFTGQRAFRHG